MEEQKHFLDTALAQIPLSDINLSDPDLTALADKDLNSIGDIYELKAEGLALALNIDYSKAELIWSNVLAVISNPDNWFSISASPPKINLPEVLIDAIKNFFYFIVDKPRYYTVIVRRFGLNETSKYSLEEIGIYFEIARERVRQIESQGLKLLINFFIKYNQDLPKYPSNNSFENTLDYELIRQEIKELFSLFNDDIEPIKVEDSIFDKIENRYDLKLSNNQKAHFRLLFKMFEWKYIRNFSGIQSEIDPFWIIHNDFKASILKDAVKRTEKFLQGVCTRISYWDMKIGVNRRLKKPYSDLILRSAINISPDIETLDDDYFQIKFSRLRNAQDQAYRVLNDIGVPTRTKDIHREISRRLAISGDKAPVLRTLANAMSSDKERFIPIGRSEWALEEWDNVVSENIIDLITDFFHKHNKPATPRQIFDYIISKRHAKESSISWYLGDSDQFVSIGNGLYQLAEWDLPENLKSGRANEHWTKKKVAELIVNIFKEKETDELPVSELISKMAEIMGDGKSFYTILRKSPAVELSVESERPRRLRAVVIHDYAFEQKPTKQEIIEDAIRAELRQQPEQTMKLTKLRDVVSKRWNTHPNNIYGYVSNMIDVQKILVDGSKTALVTLVTESNVSEEIPDTWDSEFSYDIAISYAGPDRKIAARLAEILRERKLKIFYDREQLPDLIGQNLLDELWTIYRYKSRLCVILGSAAYNESDYAQHERKAAQDREFHDPIKKPSYIVLLKLDDADLTYFASSYAYLDWNEYDILQITDHCEAQLKYRNEKLSKTNT